MRKKNTKQRISDNAFQILIDNSPMEKHNTLREAYENGFLTDVAIKTNLIELRTNPNNGKSKSYLQQNKLTAFSKSFF